MQIFQENEIVFLDSTLLWIAGESIKLEQEF